MLRPRDLHKGGNYKPATCERCGFTLKGCDGKICNKCVQDLEVTLELKRQSSYDYDKRKNPEW